MKQSIFILLIALLWLMACQQTPEIPEQNQELATSTVDTVINTTIAVTPTDMAVVIVTPSAMVNTPTATATTVSATTTPLSTATSITSTPPLTTVATVVTSPSTVIEGIITGDWVNLRAGPGTDYEIVGKKVLSQSIQVIGRNEAGDWWQLCCPPETVSETDQSQWIINTFVETSQPITTINTLLPVVNWPLVLNGLVIDGPINLRRGPGKDYAIIDQVTSNKRLEVIGRNADNTWWQVCCPSSEGEKSWIAAEYLLTNFTNTIAEERLPLIAVPITALYADDNIFTSTLTLSNTAVVTGDLVNLRSGPGLNYNIVGQAIDQQNIQITGSNEDSTWWQFCCVDGYFSWINSEFVIINPTIDKSAIPVIIMDDEAPTEETDIEKTNTEEAENLEAETSETDIAHVETETETEILVSKKSITPTAEVVTSTPTPAETPTPTSETNKSPASNPVTTANNNLPSDGGFGSPSGTNPLTGLPLPAGRQNQRPIIVCINNDPAARPQYGISQADVMYEYLMEGYVITRFSGIFYGESPSRIGPVRSARLVNYYMGSLYNAPLFCSGASDQVRFALKNQNVFSYFDVDLDDPQNSLYTQSIGRDYRTRVHTSMPKLRQWLIDWGIEKSASVRGFTFGNLADGGSTAATIYIPYTRGTSSQVEYAYDFASGRYLRSLGGVAHTDGGTGTRVALENVVIQYVTHQATDIVEDSLGSTSIRLNLFGSGRAIIFRDGVAFVGTWQSNNNGDLPHFFNQNGAEIPLKPGKTWISVVPARFEIDYN